MPLVKGVWRSKTHSETDLNVLSPSQWHRPSVLRWYRA